MEEERTQEQSNKSKAKARRTRRRKGKKQGTAGSSVEGQMDLVEVEKKLRTQRPKLVSDKGNVTIEPQSDKDGVIDMGTMLTRTSGTNSFHLCLNNKGMKDFSFWCKVLENAKNGCYLDTTAYEVAIESTDGHLAGQQKITVPIKVHVNGLGVFHIPLAFSFCGSKDINPFYIVKFVKFTIVNETSDIPGRDVNVLELRKKLVTNRVQLAKDKGRIEILPCSNKDGVIDMGCSDISVSHSFQIYIKNNNDRAIQFGFIVLGSSGDFHLDDTDSELLDKNVSHELGPLARIPVEVDVKANNPGIFNMTLAFWFKFANDKPFTIVKFIKIELSDSVVNDLKPTVPYVKPKLLPRNPAGKVIKGVPPTPARMKYEVALRNYPNPIPQHETGRASMYIAKYFQDDLTAQNHLVRFSSLLYAEERQMNMDIRRYDMEKAYLTRVPKKTDLLALYVPGLTENRPSLVVGDRLFVKKLKPNGTQETKRYEGFVHVVRLDEVHLKFSPDFHKRFDDNIAFHVEFTYSRTPLKCMHRALEMSLNFLNLLPWNEKKSECVQTSSKKKALRFYDQNIAKNAEQKQAVENIVAGTSHPYLVFGPPGTGKTVTIVEAIKQVLKSSPETKVLACAPSNSAADLILVRVSQHNVLRNNQMVRLNAYGRNSSVPPQIKKYCSTDKYGRYTFPPKEEIMSKYRLVVTTLISSGRLVSLGISKRHFTHVFIDEAGHGLEPECFVAISGFLNTDKNNGGQLVMAGDPKQLGPVLRSPQAIKFGLNISLLERLMGVQFPCYGRQSEGTGTTAYNKRLVTKLLNNYRSHPSIIKLPNELFYDGELRACADKKSRESLCQWKGLKKKGFPVMFEGVCGKDHREEKSPSFFNPQEVSVVLRYIKELSKAGEDVSVKTEEIGVISPYNRQVQKIRQSLQKKAYDIRDIKVGSVEEFQGQERRVIIISTVRSSEEFLQLDATHKLGFLSNPKRFNVAITRAKDLLIVIGNPHVLCRDQYWRRYIQFCMDNGSYRGCAFEMPEVEDDSLASQLATLGLDDDNMLCDPLENVDIPYEDKEWKMGDV